MAQSPTSSQFRIDQMIGAPRRSAAAPEKTAADKGAQQTALSAALDAAVSQEKTAAEAAAAAPAPEATPVEALEKMASETIALQNELQEKRAKVMALVFADEVVMHLGGFSKLASDLASAGRGGQTFEKVASEYPSLVKEAADSGYRLARAELEKTAAVNYDRGVQVAYKLAHEAATAEFLKAASVVNQLLRAEASR